ncbi:hypothetical protein D3C79_1036740 [compost metagenome]
MIGLDHLGEFIEELRLLGVFHGPKGLGQDGRRQADDLLVELYANFGHASLPRHACGRR